MAEDLMECGGGLELAEEEKATTMRGICVRIRVRGVESEGCERGRW